MLPKFVYTVFVYNDYSIGMRVEVILNSSIHHVLLYFHFLVCGIGMPHCQKRGHNCYSTIKKLSIRGCQLMISFLRLLNKADPYSHTEIFGYAVQRYPFLRNGLVKLSSQRLILTAPPPEMRYLVDNPSIDLSSHFESGG